MDRDRFLWCLALAGALLAILGAKCWLIATHGSPTPFWDAWVTAPKISHYVGGTLSIPELAAKHIEHRLFFPQSLSVGLFAVTGRWDTYLEMLVNAVIHTGVAALLLTMMAGPLDWAGRLLLCVFALAFFAVPLAWDSVLSGFQSQYYFVLLFGLASVKLWHASDAWSLRWLLATLAGVASYFSNASGALTLAALAVLALIQVALSMRRGSREIAGIVLHGLLVAAMVADLLNRSAVDSGLGVHSLMEWLTATLTMASWPVVTIRWPTLLRAVPTLFLAAPIILVAIKTLRERAARSDARWLYLAVAAWWALQVLSLAYGRNAGGVYSTRYYDIFSVGILLNAACLFGFFAQRATVTRPVALYLSAWLLIVTFGVGQKAMNDSARDIAWRRDTSVIQTEHVRQFLQTGDRALIFGQPEFHIPLNDAQSLFGSLSDPAVQAALAPRILGRSGFDVTMFAITVAKMLLPIGLCFILIAMALGRRPSHRFAAE